MKNISKKTLSIIITICIAAMSMTLLASCTNTQNNSAKSSNAVSANSKEDNAEDDYMKVAKNYFYKCYNYKERDYQYATEVTSGLMIESVVKGDPSHKSTCNKYNQIFAKHLATEINQLTNDSKTEIDSLDFMSDQVYNKNEMDEIRDLVDEKIRYTHGKDISDVHYLSYTLTLVGEESKTAKILSGTINVLKENGAWKICKAFIKIDNTPVETDLLSSLEAYIGNKTADTDTDVESSSKSQAEKTYGTTIGENEDYGYGSQAQSQVCPICGGSGFQQIVAYVDQNGIPVYNSVACSGCGGSGRIN